MILSNDVNNFSQEDVVSSYEKISSKIQASNKSIEQAQKLFTDSYLGVCEKRRIRKESKKELIRRNKHLMERKGT